MIGAKAMLETLEEDFCAARSNVNHTLSPLHEEVWQELMDLEMAMRTSRERLARVSEKLGQVSR